MHNDYTVWHDLDLHDISVYISIDWRYYPGVMATYHDPEEPPQVEFIRVNVPDELEYKRKEVEWVVEDELGELQEEALEYIHGLFERQQHGGHEYD
jgi:tRNA(Ser,Leu) C12 N-acetylase TAN1